CMRTSRMRLRKNSNSPGTRVTNASSRGLQKMRNPRVPYHSLVWWSRRYQLRGIISTPPLSTSSTTCVTLPP
ncbi:hypothetical protein T265_02627, partial [Opisthorchis viverrini]